MAKLKKLEKIVKIIINLRLFVWITKTYSPQNGHQSAYVLQKIFINFNQGQFPTGLTKKFGKWKHKKLQYFGLKIS